MKNLTVTTYSDPGHGFARVSHKIIRELGIAEQISRCSYMNVKYVYLEEDCDLTLFMNACKDKYNVTFNEKYADNLASCRSYSTYDAKHLGYVVGSVLTHWQGDKLTIKSFKNGKIYVDWYGSTTTIPMNKFTNYLA